MTAGIIIQLWMGPSTQMNPPSEELLFTLKKDSWVLLLYDTFHASRFHGTNMGPIWGRQDLGRPHVGPMNFAICVALCAHSTYHIHFISWNIPIFTPFLFLLWLYNQIYWVLWYIYPYSAGFCHRHCGICKIFPEQGNHPWIIWVNIS